MTSEAVGPSVDRPADRVTALGWVAIALGTAVVAAGLTGGLATGAGASIGATVTRTGMDVAGVVCVGAALLGVLTPGRVGPGPGRALLLASAAWLGLCAVDLVSRAALVVDLPPLDVRASDLTLFLSGPLAARGLLVAAAAATVVLVSASARAGAPDRPLPPLAAVLVVALVGMAGPAATGHAAAAPSGRALAVAAVALHVVAATLWVGGLGATLLLCGRPAVLDDALPRYSRLAGWCLAAVAVTGVVSATARIRAWSELVGTGYGWLLLAKAGCLVLAGLLGRAARVRLRAGRSPVLRWAGIEILVMAVAVGLAATLTQTG